MTSKRVFGDILTISPVACNFCAVNKKNCIILPAAKHAAGKGVMIHLPLHLICKIEAVRGQKGMATYIIDVINFNSGVIFGLQGSNVVLASEDTKRPPNCVLQLSFHCRRRFIGSLPFCSFLAQQTSYMNITETTRGEEQLVRRRREFIFARRRCV